MSYLLHAEVRHIRPRIARTFRMPAHATLHDLHVALQVLFGWRDQHLHEFAIGDSRYGTIDEGGDDEWDDTGVAAHDERHYRLDAVLAGKTRFIYNYDLGDNWEVDLLVRDAAADDGLPACLYGRRAGPPEDSGGAEGYQALLRVLRDPAAQEHATMREWVGADFDSEAFDLVAVNARLAARS